MAQGFRALKVTSRPHCQAIEAEAAIPTAQRDERNSLLLARLKAHGCAGRDIEAHAECLPARKAQATVHLKEVIMCADLNGAVAEIRDDKFPDRPPGIEYDVPFLQEEFTWYHALTFFLHSLF